MSVTFSGFHSGQLNCSVLLSSDLWGVVITVLLHVTFKALNTHANVFFALVTILAVFPDQLRSFDTSTPRSRTFSTGLWTHWIPCTASFCQQREVQRVSSYRYEGGLRAQTSALEAYVVAPWPVENFVQIVLKQHTVLITDSSAKKLTGMKSRCCSSLPINLIRMKRSGPN